MIGRSLSLQDTGAPDPEAVRQAIRAGQPAEMTAPIPVSRFRAWFLQTAATLAAYAVQVRRPIRFWRELAALALLLMGLTWSVPWFRSLTSATNILPANRVYFTLLGLGLAAYFLARMLAALPVEAAKRRWILLAMLVIGVLVGLKSLLYAKEVVPLTALVMRPLWAFSNFSALIPNEIVVIVTVLLTWRRGAVLSLDYIGPERVLTEFKNGFWMFLLFMGLNSFVTEESVEFGFLGAYILFGLVAMGSARMSAVGELRGGRKAVFERQRAAAVLLGAGLSALLAYWIGFNFARDGAVMAGFVVGGAVLAAFIVSIPVLLAVLYLLYWLMSLFENEISIAMTRLMNAIAGILEMVEQLKAWLRLAGEFLADKFSFLAPFFRWLFSLAPLARNLVILLVLLAAGGLVFLVLYIRARRLRDPEAGETDEAIALRDLLAALRKGLLKNLADRQASIAGALDFRQRYRERLANRIRKVYADLMDLAESLGAPRQDAQTPLEYQRTLERLFPGETAAVGRVTEAYLGVRYGELPEDVGETRAVEQAFLRIRKAAGHKTEKRNN